MERQLMRKLRRMGLECLRVAGSAGPDVVTAVKGKTILFECKYTTKERVYVPKEEIEREKRIAKKMGAQLYLVVKFGREEWITLDAFNLEQFDRGKSYLFVLSEINKFPRVTSLLDRNLNDYD